MFQRRFRSGSSSCSLGRGNFSRRRVVCLSLVLLKVLVSATVVRYFRSSGQPQETTNLPCDTWSNGVLYDEQTRKLAVSHLKILASEFDNATLPYFAFGATHLSAVLYGDLAAWDSSVDLGLLARQRPAVLEIIRRAFPNFKQEIDTSLDYNWRITVKSEVATSTAVSSVTEVTTTTGNETVLQPQFRKPEPFEKFKHVRSLKEMHFALFFFDDDSSTIWLRGTSYSFGKHIVFPLRRIQFEDFHLSVPNDQLLEKMYGSGYAKKCLLQ